MTIPEDAEEVSETQDLQTIIIESDSDLEEFTVKDPQIGSLHDAAVHSATFSLVQPEETKQSIDTLEDNDVIALNNSNHAKTSSQSQPQFRKRIEHNEDVESAHSERFSKRQRIQEVSVDQIASNLESLSKEELELYDRQIRLWGLEGQARLGNGRVFMINMNSVGNEIAKTLVLAGIKSLTILDDTTVTEKDIKTQFFIRRTDIGRNRGEAAIPRISILNPHVVVQRMNKRLEDLSAAELEQFNIVIVNDHTFNQITNLNTKCRQASTSLYASGAFGLFAYIFVDLISHKYIVERKTKVKGQREEEIIKERHECHYIPFGDIQNAKMPSEMTPKQLRRTSFLLPLFLGIARFEKKFEVQPNDKNLKVLKDIINEICSELNLPTLVISDEKINKFFRQAAVDSVPVASVIGSILGQDVLNVLSRRERPITNLLVYEGDSFSAPIYDMHS